MIFKTKLIVFIEDIRPFVNNPSQVTVTEGETTILECVTGESAPPPQVYWEKDGQPVTSGSEFKARFGTHSYDMIGQYYMKLILDSKPRETGLYSCVAVNTAQGIQVKSLVVQVKISGKKRSVKLRYILQQQLF